MLKLHYLENSRAQRILWLLEELNLEYEVVTYHRDPVTQLAPAELKAIHPLGKSPVLEDKGIMYAESGAIVEYLIDSYGQYLKPEPDADDYRDYVFWMHFAEGSLMPPLVMNLIFDAIKNPPLPFIVKAALKPIATLISNEVIKGYVAPTMIAMLDLVEKTLADRPWILGEKLSGADFMVSFPLEGLVTQWPPIKDYPNICRYVERIQSRDAYQAALAKGLPYDMAL